MRAVFLFVHRVLALAVALFLQGCLIDREAVLGPQGAEYVPGLAGHWEYEVGDRRRQLYITATRAGRYHVRYVPETGTEQVFEGVYLHPLAGKHRGYVASLPEHGIEHKRLLFVLELSRKWLALRRELDTDVLREAAVRTNVQVDLSDPRLGAGATKEDALRLLTAIARGNSPASLSHAEYYERKGWFGDQGTEEDLIDRALDLYIEDQDTAALAVLLSLVDRGSAEASALLGGMWTEHHFTRCASHAGAARSWIDGWSTRTPGRLRNAAPHR